MNKALKIQKVTLFKADETKDGLRLSKVDQQRFEGILPEGVSFDRSGNYILASVFQDSPEHSQKRILKVFGVRGDKEEPFRGSFRERVLNQEPNHPAQEPSDD